MQRGVILSLSASVLFAGLYFLPATLAPLTGQEIFGWRTALTLPLILALIFAMKRSQLLITVFRNIRRRPQLAIVYVFTASLLGFQHWLFTWAPTHGHGLDVALGFFLMPLVLVVVGLVIYRERLSPIRLTAVILALIGVINEVALSSGVSWPTLFVGLGFPVYFVVRRHFNTATTGGFIFELMLMFPFGVWFVVTGPSLEFALDLKFQIVALGTVGTVSTLFYLMASQRLPFILFGLLSYVEPILLVLVALFLLGEDIAGEEWLTYIAIWLAIATLGAEGALRVLRARRHRGSNPPPTPSGPGI